MSTKTSKTTTKATNAKKEQSVAEFRDAIRIQTAEKAKERKEKAKEAAPKANGKAPAAKAAPVTAKPTEAKEKAEKPAPKSNGIANGGETKCNEAVGIHFSIAKTVLDDGKATPEIGDLVMVKIGESEIPLIVRVAQEKVNGDLFVQAFLVEKGSGHHEILGKAKDTMVKVFWA